MPSLTPKEHLRRFNELETQAANFRNIWEELQNYITPFRSPVTSAKHSGQKLTDKIFDSTAVHAAVLASSALHGMTMPAATTWFALKHPVAPFNDIVEIGAWLESSASTLLDEFNASNLSQESQELLLDILVSGTGCLHMAKKPPDASLPFPGFRFKSLATGTYVVAENEEGIVDTLYRKFRLSAEAIFRRWGNNSGKMVLEALKANKFDQQMTMVHAVTPRDPREVANAPTESTPSERKPFEEIYMVTSGTDASNIGATAGTGTGTSISEKDAEIVERGGLLDFPFLVPRWRKISGESYGRSPGIDALPDVRTLNQAVEFRLKAWSLAIGPPIATSDRGVIGDVRLVPFGRTHVRGDARQAIQPLNIGANFDVANFQEEQLRAQIRTAFFIDQLRSAQSQGLSPISATEVSINFELMMRLLGPVGSRFEVEFLGPLVRTGYLMMLRAGAFGPPPDESLSAEGRIGVRYQGPLARSQSIQEVDAVNRWLQVSLPIAELKPEILAWIDFRELGKTLADAVSVPREVMKNRKTVEQETEEERARLEQQAQQADLLTGAEVLNKVGPTVTALPRGA